MNKEDKNEVRIDKWLWAVRIYKTRSLAAEACRKGKVLIKSKEVKPGKNVQINDVITVHKDNIHYTFRVKELIAKRTSAKLVSQYLKDLTPAGELERKKIIHRESFIYRPRGTGRPTKKERRLLDRLNDEEI